jgi:hypothetical protein
LPARRPDHDFSIRTGLRWGGIEPTLFPALAMELSVWYEGHFRRIPVPMVFTVTAAMTAKRGNPICFGPGPRWPTRCPKASKAFTSACTAGTSEDADRFSAYRIGGFLPLVAEFPLSLPGYYFQEISARQFVLLNANYLAAAGPEKALEPERGRRQRRGGLPARRRGSPATRSAAWAAAFCTRAVRPLEDHAGLRLRH